MPLLAPSILSADFSKLEHEISRIEKAGANWVHVDVMDGQFVPNLTLGYPVISKIRKTTELFFDVHLMIFDPHKYIKNYCDAGADLVSFHMEAYRYGADKNLLAKYSNPDAKFWWGNESQEKWEATGGNPDDYDIDAILNTINLIKAEGKKAGIALNPSTPVSCLEQILPEVNLVLLMSVNAGFGGQKFKDIVFTKINQLKEMSAKLELSMKTELDPNAQNKEYFRKELKDKEFVVEVDGGVKEGKIISELTDAGFAVFVAGSAVYGSRDLDNTVSILKGLKSHEQSLQN